MQKVLDAMCDATSEHCRAPGREVSGGIGEALEMARCKVRTPFLNWSNLFSKIDE